MSEDKDLLLLEQALVKFSMASDDQFPTLTGALLPPLLEKLSSPNQAVKAKVLKVLSHINQRYRAELTWRLPVQPVLDFLQSSATKEPIAVNFALCYILSGLGRENDDVQKEAMLRLIQLVPSLHEGCQQHIFSAFVHLIAIIRTKGPKEQREKNFSFLLNDTAKKLFLAYALDLFHYGQSVQDAISGGHSGDSQRMIQVTPLSGIQAQLPGAVVVPQIGSYTLPQLTEKKIGLLAFLKENLDIFADNDLYVISAVASCDPINDVQRQGDDLFKRLSKTPLSDKSTVTKLIQLFMGEGTSQDEPLVPMNSALQSRLQADTRGVGGGGGGGAGNTNLRNANTIEEGVWKTRRTPVPLTTRLKILELIARSPIAASLLPISVQFLFNALFGPFNKSYPKLQQLALGFCQNMIRELSGPLLKATSPIILSGLSKYMAALKEIEASEQGVSTTWNHLIEPLRIATLHCFAALGNRAPSLFSSNITFIEDLMIEMRETKSVVLKSSIQEALTSLCPAFSILSDQAQARMKILLASNFEITGKIVDQQIDSNAMQVDEGTVSVGASSNPAAPIATSSAHASTHSASTPSLPSLPPPTVGSKYIAQFYANRVFPFSDAFARYLNLLGSNDPNTQVVQEANRGLEPFKVVENEIVSLVPKPGSHNDPNSKVASASLTSDSRPENSIPWPSFSVMMSHAISRRNSTLKDRVLPFPAPTYQAMIGFLLRLLNHHRTMHPLSSAVKQQSMELSSSSQASKSNPVLANFFTFLLDAIVSNATANIAHKASEAFLQVLQYEPLSGPNPNVSKEDLQVLHSIPSASIDKVNSAEKLLSTVLEGRISHETMKNVARIISIIVLSDNSLRKSILERAFQGVLDKSNLKRDSQVGAIYTVSYIIANSLKRKLAMERHDDMIAAILTTLNMAKEDKVLHHGLTNPLLLASCEAIGIVGRWSPQVASITVPNRDSSAEAKSEPTKTSTTALDCIVALLGHTDATLIISAAYSLANLTLGDRNLILNHPEALQALFETFRVKSEESHFSIGEAFSIIAYGWHSTAATDTIVVSNYYENEAREAQTMTDTAFAATSSGSAISRDVELMQRILNVILQEYLLSSRPDTRMASAIWILSLLKNCGPHPELLKQLKAIQAAFTNLLSDSNEIIQEVAGKGLAQIYELGDETTKKELVNSLVNALQKGASSFKVTAESEIFNPGQLGTTPSGDKLTTYRELVTLASEMNQPDLIYKFMQLSAHNALWNSKKGAAFATGELAGRAKAQIAPHLPLLVPKLYRASFDPNPKIAASMNSILRTLVSDPKDIIVQHIHEVLRDLLTHVVDSQWRTRESCCNALADLLPTRDYDQVADELKDLWGRCFQVLDDIKESVRKAAENFKKSLSTLTLRICDPSYTNREHGRLALNIALPYLLDKGLLSSVKEVRFISINMILRLSKVASFLLKPHVASLVPVLLKSLAMLDSSELNYLEQHASKVGLAVELFDEARVAMAKSSPVHATLDFCIQQVDTQNVTDLGPQLASLLSAENHISTRAGTAHVITQLALSRPTECRVVAHKLMLALKRGIGARSVQVRRAYGYAMGQLAKCAKKKTIEIVVNGLLDSYKNAPPEDADMRSAVAEALLELAKSSVVPRSDTDVSPTPTPAPPSSESSTLSPSLSISKEALSPSSPTRNGTTTSPSQNEASSSSSSSSLLLTTRTSESPSISSKPSLESTSFTTSAGKAAVPVLAPMLNSVVPVVFLARFDTKEETSKLFNKIWDECGASLALYVPETVATFATALESSSWQMKQQGAKAIAKFAETLNLSQFTEQAPKLLHMLINGLKGRTWSGKEALLEALAKLIACCADMWTDPSLVPSNKITPEELLKTISGEVMRKSLEYKKAALTCLGDVLRIFSSRLPDYDSLKRVEEMLVEHATTIHTEESAAATTSGSSSQNAFFGGTSSVEEKKDEETALSRSIRLLAIQALCAGFPEARADMQKQPVSVILNLLARTYKTTNQYTVKIAVLNSLKIIFKKIQNQDWEAIISSELLQQSVLASIIYPSLADPKYSVIRTAACVTLIELLEQAMDTAALESVVVPLEKAVLQADKLGSSPASSDRLLALFSRAKNV